MQFRFDEAATVQAAAYLLEKAGGRLNYTKLIKFLYLTEREMLTRFGYSLTGAHCVSMDNGPVLSEVLDLIKNKPMPKPYRLWWEHIGAPQGYDVTLKKPAGQGHLNRAATQVLDEVYGRFAAYSLSRLIDYCHSLKEWRNPHGSVLPIEPESILRFAGWDEKRIAEVAKDTDHFNAVDDMVAEAN